MKRNQVDSLIRIFVYLWLLSTICCFKAHGQVAVTPFVTSQPQFFDGNGKPLASGCIFTYAAGTTTNQATYTDSTGTVQNANPIILNSGGFPPSAIWLSSLSYKFKVMSFGGTACASGSTIRTEDNVRAPVSSNLANTFTGTTTFSGPIVSSGTNTFSGSNTFANLITSSTPVADVRAFGAKCDGVTADDAAFASATTAANSAGLSLFIPATGTGCKLNNAWNLTALKPGFTISGVNTASASVVLPSVLASSIICNNTAGSGICIDMTGGGNGVRISNLQLVPLTASGGSVIDIFCTRSSAASSGPQHLRLDNVLLWLNSSGSSTHPSIGLYNGGCELADYNNLSISADLPMYVTISNPSSATYTATSPYVTVASGTSTSSIHCDRCTLVNISSLTPAIVTESAFDNEWTNLYITCKGAGAGSQYAMSLLHPTRNIFTGRQEACGKLAHLSGAISSNKFLMGTLPGSVTANSYIDIDGTVSATAYPTEGNDFIVFDQVAKTSFTAYNWLSNSSIVADNLFDTRSGQNDGTVAVTASICGANTVRGKGTGSTLAISGCPDSQVLAPSATNYNAKNYFIGTNQSGGAQLANNTGNTINGVTGTIFSLANANVNFLWDVDTSGNLGLLGGVKSGNGNALGTTSISGITNAAGLQAFSTTTTCTTAATINSPCTTAAITLPVGYSDTSYRLSCSGLARTNFPQIIDYGKSNTTFTITLNNLTAAAATYASFDCVVGHN